MSKAVTKVDEDFIPDYDHLFTEERQKNGKVKNRIVSKLVLLNIWPIILSCLIYVIQFSPVIITPLFISDIINVATRALVGNGSSERQDTTLNKTDRETATEIIKEIEFKLETLKTII